MVAKKVQWNNQEGITTPLQVVVVEAESGQPGWEGLHKPCLAREAETWSASVDSWGESVMLMLPEDDTVLSWWGESSKETISAPWSVRALAVSRKVSLWLSICDADHRMRSRVYIAAPLVGKTYNSFNFCIVCIFLYKERWHLACKYLYKPSFWSMCLISKFYFIPMLYFLFVML